MEKLLHISVSNYMGQPQYIIYYQLGDGEPVQVPLPAGDWNKSVIIDRLVRSKYSQDMVEAIVNNHFLNIAEWLDAKFAGSTESFVDVEYDEMQGWRKACKRLAEEALRQHPAI